GHIRHHVWRALSHLPPVLGLRGGDPRVFLTHPAPPAPSPLSLHDALPICRRATAIGQSRRAEGRRVRRNCFVDPGGGIFRDGGRDRKSTRLNSSHWPISYAVFCLKKKGLAALPIAAAMDRGPPRRAWDLDA